MIDNEYDIIHVYFFPQHGISTSCTQTNKGELIHDKRTTKVYQCDGQMWRDWVAFNFENPNSNQQQPSGCEQGIVNWSDTQKCS